MKTEIIYEDASILVVYKPAGLAVQTARTGQADCVSELKNYLHGAGQKQGEPYLGVVHRLDQPVEGLLVFARTRETAAALSAQLTDGLMNKRYLAVVWEEGRHEDEAAVLGPAAQEWQLLEDNLERDGRTGLARVCGADGGGKPASLRYRRIARAEGLSELEVELMTGRFHQIRVQMAYHGMPLLGDRKYGTKESAAAGSRLGIPNVALCACRLALTHPVTGRQEVWECRPQNPAFQRFPN